MAKYKQAGLKKVEWNLGPEDGRECAVCAARGGKVYLIDEAPIIPAHPRCRCIYAGVVELSNEDVEVDGPAADAAFEAAQQQKKLQKAAESSIIEGKSKPPATESTAESEISTKAGGDVNKITQIDLNIYARVASDITTLDTVITEERILHIKERHPGDWERYGHLIQSTIDDPDYVLADKNPNTAICIKKVKINEGIKHLRTTLRLHVNSDEDGRENSVLTFQKINIKEYGRLSRNKNVVYKRE